MADGFRNYLKDKLAIPAEHLLIDRPQLLVLTAPEMTVPIGGIRVLNANVGSSLHEASTRSEALTNDFFANLLDMGTEWTAVTGEEDLFEGHNRDNGLPKWTAIRVYLIFGSNVQLSAIAEVYGSADAQSTFVADFVAAWVKLMNLEALIERIKVRGARAGAAQSTAMRTSTKP